MPDRVILVVVAHPDDCELTCAGSIVRWVAEGDEAFLVVASDGARGGKNVGSQEEAMARERRAEQEAAAQLIGFGAVEFLDFPDGELEEGPVLRRALVEVIRRIRPDVAIFMDPLTVIHRDSYVNHRDHRVLGTAMLDAMYPQASNAGYFPEQIAAGLQPHKVPEFFLAQSDRPNYWVDVTETIDRRFEALRRHTSQIRLWPDNGEAIVRQQRALASVLGVEHGMGYAEEFRRVVINPLG